LEEYVSKTAFVALATKLESAPLKTLKRMLTKLPARWRQKWSKQVNEQRKR